jgi:hypothetical protein
MSIGGGLPEPQADMVQNPRLGATLLLLLPGDINYITNFPALKGAFHQMLTLSKLFLLHFPTQHLQKIIYYSRR